MSFEIHQASRVGVIPWIDLYSESGCGKTMSALLLARGLAGPSGKIVGVDSESRRMSLYADVIPGGFAVIDIGEPFTPARYIEALDVAAKSGAAAVVADSLSHEWEGIGGVLDMAGDNEARSGKQGLHNWKTPKLEHAKLVQFLLRFPVPLICCIRAKYKTRQRKDSNGKTVIVKDEVTSPIQAEDFIFEATAHAEILPNHSINLTKCSHPDLRACFPTEGPICIEHGAKIAEWCRKAGQPRGESQAAKPADSPDVKKLKKQLWDMTASKHEGNKARLQQWLWDECLMPPDEQLEAKDAAGLSAIITAAKGKL